MNFRLIPLLITTSLLFLSTQIFAQNFDKVDSLGIKMCETVTLITSQNDLQNKPTIFGDLIDQLERNHLDPFFKQHPESATDSYYLLIELRLERNCEVYGKLAYENAERKSDWTRHTEKPIQNIKEENCQDFYKIENYTYIESNGDKVELEIRNGYWIDHFKDGTFSKLKVTQLNYCEFEIEFIESNNDMRESFSKKGDKYKYHILDLEKGYYKLSVEIPEQSVFYTFNLYYKN